MKISKNILLGMSALLTTAAVGVAWQQFWKAARLEAMLAGRDDSAEGQQRLAAAERRARTLEMELAARNQPAGEAAGETFKPAATPTANRGGPGSGRGGRGDMRAVMERPEMQQLRALQQKAALDSRFAPLFKSLNLSPEKIGQLKTLLAEKESTMQDLMMAAREQGVDPRSNPEGLRKLVTAAQSEINAQLKSLLGDESYAQYEQYTQTQPQRATVEQLRQSLSYTREPLTDPQASQLVQILAANAPAAPDGAMPMPPPDGGGRGFGGGPGGGGRGPGGATASALITTAAVAQAQTVLSTTQFQALQQMQSLQQAQQQAMQAVRNSETSSGVPVTGGATTSTSRSGGRS